MITNSLFDNEHFREFDSLMADIPEDAVDSHPFLLDFDNLNLLEAKVWQILSMN